jgi:acyl-CoA thioesterase FadM
VVLKDKVFVYTALVKTGTTSFELEYKLVREEKDGSETIMSTGTSVIVCYNYKEKKPVKIPALWLEKMAAF